MQIAVTREEAETLRDLLRQKILELDQEINRTDSLAFKAQLHQLERRIEHVLGEISTALSGS